MRNMTIAAAICVWLSSPASASCYKDVIEFAEGICAEFVGLEGDTAAQKYSGQLGASLNGLIAKLADLEGDVDVNIARSKYTNLLQEDVPKALQDGRVCRLDVASLFFDKICPSTPSAPATVSPAQPVVSPAPAPVPAGTWFVVAGSYPHSDVVNAQSRQQALKLQGLTTNLINTNDYTNFSNGLYAVVVGPMSKAAAQGELNNVRRYVPDAYIKTGF